MYLVHVALRSSSLEPASLKKAEAPALDLDHGLALLVEIAQLAGMCARVSGEVAP
tara:strand:- start:168 stop:332 length:165 start_codon:yes stop_codon:yes gene_type:complete